MIRCSFKTLHVSSVNLWKAWISFGRYPLTWIQSLTHSYFLPLIHPYLYRYLFTMPSFIVCLLHQSYTKIFNIFIELALYVSSPASYFIMQAVWPWEVKSFAFWLLTIVEPIVSIFIPAVSLVLNSPFIFSEVLSQPFSFSITQAWATFTFWQNLQFIIHSNLPITPARIYHLLKLVFLYWCFLGIFTFIVSPYSLTHLYLLWLIQYFPSMNSSLQKPHFYWFAAFLKF